MIGVCRLTTWRQEVMLYYPRPWLPGTAAAPRWHLADADRDSGVPGGLGSRSAAGLGRNGALGRAALAQGTLYMWQGRFRTRLSVTGIEAHGYFGHFIPWPEVTGLDIGGFTVPDAEAVAITGTPWNSPVKQPMSRAAFNSEAGYRGKLATIRVTQRNGRSVMLRAPLVTSWQDDPGFDDKARVIRQWWHDYGQGPAGRAH
jgi:hypothetical protein